MNDVVLQMTENARNDGVPVMQDEGIAFICDYIRAHNVRTILEIGSAVGCSALCFASVSPDVRVVTVELDEKRYLQAVENISLAGMESQIHVIHGDALTSETSCKVQAALGGEKADLVFLDAAKSQYISFFEEYKKFLAPSGAIISDNLLFHGMTAGYRKTYNYNTIKLLRKIRGFIIFLKANRFFETTFYTVGDGVSVSVMTKEDASATPSEALNRTPVVFQR